MARVRYSILGRGPEVGILYSAGAQGFGILAEGGEGGLISRGSRRAHGVWFTKGSALIPHKGVWGEMAKRALCVSRGLAGALANKMCQ